jgi:hypothetical protein
MNVECSRILRERYEHSRISGNAIARVETMLSPAEEAGRD